MATIAAARTGHACPACGRIWTVWSARCQDPACGAWLKPRAQVAHTDAREGVRPPADPRPAEPTVPAPGVPPRPLAPRDARARAEVAADDADDAQLEHGEQPSSVPVPITEVDVSAEHARCVTGIEPLDRVLGGGVVVGSMILLSGEPGAGKSTLLMQMLGAVTRDGSTALYASGEESERQVAMRAHRVGAAHPSIRLVHENSVEGILWHARQGRPRIVVVDSVHAVSSASVNGGPGDPHQIRTCSRLLMSYAKRTETMVIAIAHVNGEGGINGPKTLEHDGDVTLMLGKSELGEPWRELRVLKNRFGSTSEVGLFEMAASGLIPVEGGAAPIPTEQSDEMRPVAQELLYRFLELGGELDAGLRDRIAGRLDLESRGQPA